MSIVLSNLIRQTWDFKVFGIIIVFPVNLSFNLCLRIWQITVINHMNEPLGIQYLKVEITEQ